MINIYDLKFEELQQQLVSFGVAKFRGKQVWNWLYKSHANDFNDMKNLDKKTIEILQHNYFMPNFEQVKLQKATDGTQKALLRLSDGNLIETVLMKYKHGYSVCVTTQIGCAVGCSFCASGLLGFTRNLSSGEVVMQVAYWNKQLASIDERVSNVVVMGIGEPFNNYKNTLKFIDIINDDNGFNIGARHITVSTSGIVPKIYELCEYDKQINLAISLHSADDHTRSSIMKINDAYDLEELMTAVKYYISHTNRRVSFEYIMLRGVNDSEMDAIKLANLVHGLNCHVNIIPYNAVDENVYKATEKQSIDQFVSILEKRRIQVTLRRANGEEIDGACGQLRHKEKENNA